MRSPLLLALLPLAACGGTSSDSVSGTESPTRLVVEQTTDRTQSWTLTCDPSGGDHPDPAAACAALNSVADPFAPLPADIVCTQQYGGPQTARITGTFRGAPVDLELSRIDGCRISQWDRLGAVLPGPVGVDPPS
jgi:hypothetical protein